ncbi:MAG: twin-arginine translocase subunit TatC [Flavobacteriaceae bacterium]|jgi:sec-independent protein translocase protein TatC|nr:twin-arginine translocase subunit TatC [Flavobacteriaceae bacterium]MDG1327427.1 twin-arginine translocase subunit TatC [Flavobacteriaceae bacterium]MDG1790831.1 twin-arginine translocase subunit TatC [Flavobacteriaceae bacterium]MDG2447776.1 twin-arginine translocase subunit TatC [Flavobacteriaceae bacterium]
MSKSKSIEKEMSFLDHLEELRWHLIRSVFAIVILASIAFIAKDFIFNVLIFGPKQSNFPTYQVLCEIAKFIGFKDSFCFTELPFRIQSRTMGGQFSAHIWTSITAGFIIAFPYILHEMWKFISPGLRVKERSSAKGFIFIASLLFFVGVLFGYYVVTPLSINFLGTYQVSGEVHNDFDLSSYISLVRASVIASGLIFELPILIYILTKVGVVSPKILKKYRKISLVIVLILSAIITPPDIASQVIVSVPIIVLYEISIYISKAVIRKQQRVLKKQTKSK